MTLGVAHVLSEGWAPEHLSRVSLVAVTLRELGVVRLWYM